MLLLTSTSDLVRVVTGSSGAIECHASWMDYDGSVVTPGRTNTAQITTATTTTVVGSPASSTQRNVKHLSIKNDHASTSNAIEVFHTDGTNVETLWEGTLLAGEFVVLDANGEWKVYTSNGVVKNGVSSVLFNASATSQGPGFSSDTYLTGSFIVFPGAPKVGTKYKLRFDVSKTGAGVATPIVTVRLGTAGTTSDTARCTFTFTAGTANADVGTFEVFCVFRTVGSGTSAVLQGRAEIRHGLSATTGLVNLVAPTLQVTSGGFDSTVANLGIGASVNGGTSAAWTVQMVDAELMNF